MLRRIGPWFVRMAAEKPVHLAFWIFLVATAIVIPASFPYYLADPYGFLEGVLQEAHGMVFDLLVIGWFLFWLNKMAERRIRANRYREEIEDFLGWQSPEATHRIAGNLRRLNRIGVNEQLRLTEAHLAQANLGGVKLRKSNLWGANLEGAILGSADLSGTNLAGASLVGAILEHARLDQSDLRGATLREADLERASLERADLRGASLISADLQYALLAHARLDRSSLVGTNLHGAILDGASLRRANLEGASLRGASLVGADLRDVKLTEVDLARADLTGARLPEGHALLALFERARSFQGTLFDPHVEDALAPLRLRRFGRLEGEPPAVAALGDGASEPVEIQPVQAEAARARPPRDGAEARPVAPASEPKGQVRADGHEPAPRRQIVRE